VFLKEEILWSSLKINYPKEQIDVHNGSVLE
jgi:hypothetical protein